MKKTVIFITAIFLLIILPVYGAARLILPEWIKLEIQKSLPEGSALDIQFTKSLSNLEIIYENISFSFENFETIAPKIIFKPRLSLSSPLLVKVPSLTVASESNILQFNNARIEIYPNDVKLQAYEMEGNIETLSNDEKLILTNTKFLIAMISGGFANAEIYSDNLILDWVMNDLDVNLNVTGADLKISNSKEVSVNLLANEFELKFSDFKSNEFRSLSGKRTIGNLELRKDEVWISPVSLDVQFLASHLGKIGEDLKLSAQGVWSEKSSSCFFEDIIRSNPKCGKLIHVLKLNSLLSSGNGRVSVMGSGWCVAPKSGCRQQIKSVIRSNDTSNIFSEILQSGIVNPLVGGVLMGSLLSSPNTDDRSFSHQVKLDVIGNQIFLNGEPLIR